jgi:hypothetical protein
MQIVDANLNVPVAAPAAVPEILPPPPVVQEHPVSERVQHVAREKLFQDPLPFSDDLDEALQRLKEKMICLAAEFRETASYLSKDFIQKIREIVYLFYKLFAFDKLIAVFVDFCITHATREENIQAKIKELQVQMMKRAESDHPIALAKMLTHWVYAYFHHYLVNACVIDPALRPEWIRSFIVEQAGEKTEYNTSGTILSVLIKNQKELLLQILELNFLKIFDRFYEKIIEIEDKNPFTLFDITHDLAQELHYHFNECHVERDHPKPEVSQSASDPLELPTAPFIDEKMKELLHILLPKQGKEFEMPASSCFTAYLKEFTWDVVYEEVVPEVCQFLYRQVTSRYSKDVMLSKLYEFLYKKLDQQPSESAHANAATEYPRQQELNTAVGAALYSFLEYADPKSKKEVESYYNEQSIGNLLGTVITQEYGMYSVVDLLNYSCGELLLVMRPEGKWEVKDGGVREFTFDPFAFAVSMQEKVEEEQRKEEQAKLKHKMLEEQVNVFGSELKGLQQMIQKRFIGRMAEPSSTGFFSRALRSVTGAALDQYFSTKNVKEKVQALSKEMFVKLQDPCHHRLLPAFVRITVENLRV